MVDESVDGCSFIRRSGCLLPWKHAASRRSARADNVAEHRCPRRSGHTFEGGRSYLVLQKRLQLFGTATTRCRRSIALVEMLVRMLFSSPRAVSRSVADQPCTALRENALPRGATTEKTGHIGRIGHCRWSVLDSDQRSDRGVSMTDNGVVAAPTEGLAELTDSVLESRICSLAGRLAAATYLWMVLIAEFDRRGAWSGWGVKSCAHWLTWSCSMSPAAAREHVRVARSLAGLPAVSAAFGAGTLSYSKVRALTRVAATIDETTLLSLATAETASQLERTVRGYRKANGAGLSQQRKRKARVWWDEDGMLVMSARLPSDEGAVLMAALAAAESTLDAPSEPGDRAREDKEADKLNIDARALTVADALVVMARTALQAEAADESGEDRHLVVLHVDESQLGLPGPTRTDDAPPADEAPTVAPDGGATEPVAAEPSTEDETAAVEPSAVSEPGGAMRQVQNGPGVDPATSERMACDALVVAIVQSTVTGTLNAGRRTRRISAALRRALGVRDGGCQFPGCSRRTHLEAHHIKHWFHGGARTWTISSCCAGSITWFCTRRDSP